jgi:hypothetical protein
VWFTKFAEGKLKPEKFMLCLITTATAKEDSPLAWLRKGAARNVEQARTKLVEVATARGNQNLTAAYDVFLNTSDVDQERLLSAVYIVDNAPTIDEVEPKIKQIINGIRASNLDAAYERLEGWWFAKVIRHLLDDSREGISQYLVKEKIADINEQLQPNSLPIDFEAYEPTEAQLTQGLDRVFVHQLRALQLGTRRIKFAVLDYYRAFEQRSKWMRDTLIIDDDLLHYEKRLTEEWERHSAYLEDLFPQISEEEQVIFGKELLNWMEKQANVPIRTNMPAGHEYVMRGSFHWLADKDAPEVYWHPKFLDQLEAILNPVQP